jgi:hypothetical protein
MVFVFTRGVGRGHNVLDTLSYTSVALWLILHRQLCHGATLFVLQVVFAWYTYTTVGRLIRTSQLLFLFLLRSALNLHRICGALRQNGFQSSYDLTHLFPFHHLKCLRRLALDASFQFVVNLVFFSRFFSNDIAIDLANRHRHSMPWHTPLMYINICTIPPLWIANMQTWDSIAFDRVEGLQ